MKNLAKFLLLIFIVSNCISCSDEEEVIEEYSSDYNELIESGIEEWECGTYNGNVLYTGPRGGCYYKNSNGNKTYVDRSECKCSSYGV